jgi:hypothetical protein
LSDGSFRKINYSTLCIQWNSKILEFLDKTNDPSVVFCNYSFKTESQMRDFKGNLVKRLGLNNKLEDYRDHLHAVQKCLRETDKFPSFPPTPLHKINFIIPEITTQPEGKTVASSLNPYEDLIKEFGDEKVSLALDTNCQVCHHCWTPRKVGNKLVGNHEKKGCSNVRYSSNIKWDSFSKKVRRIATSVPKPKRKLQTKERKSEERPLKKEKHEDPSSHALVGSDEVLIEKWEVIVVKDDTIFDFSSISLNIQDCKSTIHKDFQDLLSEFLIADSGGVLNDNSLSTWEDGKWLDDVVSLIKIRVPSFKDS